MHSHGFSIRSELKKKSNVSISQYIRRRYPPPKKYPGILGAIYEEIYWFFRQFAFWISYEWEDNDIEEFDAQIIRYKPECLDVLCKRTKFTRKELQFMYRGFKQGCPNGVVSLEQFKQIYAQFFPHAASKVDKYARFVFNTFDKDSNGQINFEEFVVGMSVLSRGCITEKLEWIFRLYDINRNGQITRDELNAVVTSIYELLGKTVEPPFDTNTVNCHVTEIYTKLDRKHSGVITKEEFINACTQDMTIGQSLSLFDTVL